MSNVCACGKWDLQCEYPNCPDGRGEPQPLVPREPHDLARRGNPDTSRLAAAAVVKRLNDLQVLVLGHFVLAGDAGLTDRDLEEACSDRRSTLRTRRAELTVGGLLRDTGRRVEQEGTLRAVWAVTPEGVKRYGTDRVE